MQGLVTGVGGKTEFKEDIYESCIREIKEETGYQANNLKLNGIIKTVSRDNESSWILFVYSTSDYSGEEAECTEGRLFWVDKNSVNDYKLIGFISEIITYVLEGELIEGTIIHDNDGRVISKCLRKVI